MSLRTCMSLFLLTLSLPAAIAQTHFCVGGELDHLRPADMAACQQKLSNLRDVVAQHGAPADWHFVVICDETGWADYASFVRTSSPASQNAIFDTDAPARRTFVHASAMGTSYGEAMRVVFAAIPRNTQDLAPALHMLPVVKRPQPYAGLSIARGDDQGQAHGESEAVTAMRGE